MRRASNIYFDWLPKDAVDILAKGEGVDCGQCLMAREGRYKESLKCCTFQPFIPNYVAGLIDEEIGLENFNLRNVDFLEIGLVPNRQYYRRSTQNTQGFGQNDSLLCDFFNQQTRGCSIWAFRPSECLGYFCKSNFGDIGLEFWESLASYIYLIEANLSYCLILELGVPSKKADSQFNRINPEQGIGEANDFEVRGDILGFYKKSAELFQDLDSKEFERNYLSQAKEFGTRLAKAINKLKMVEGDL